MTFRRHLSDPALAAFQPLAPVLRAWADRDRCSVELRRDDVVTCYFRGQSALGLRAAPGLRWTGRPFRGTAWPLDGPDAVAAALDAARDAIGAHVKSVGGELDLQADMVAATHRGHDDALVLDQQVAVPRAALRSDRHTRHRVDVLAMHRRTGAVWLVEIKTATADDLDGDVLDQLDLTATLPAALVGGEAAFLDAYHHVARQKRALGLIPPDAPEPAGPVRAALMVIGGHAHSRASSPWMAQARARIACWDDPPGHPGLLAEHGESLRLDDLRPLAQVHADALASERAPYAPRRSR